MSLNRKRRPHVVLLGTVAVAVISLTVSSCSSSSSSSAAAPTSAAPSATSGSDQAKAKIAALSGAPTFAANPSFNMGSLKGKNIVILTATLAVPFVANIAKAVQEAAGVVGWKATVVDGKGSITEWSRVVQQAVSQKVDGIITIGASPAQFKPAVAAAQAGGIPVVDTLTADQALDPLVPGTFSHVSISFHDSGALQADYVIANGAPDAHVLIFGDNEFPGEVARVQGMQEEFTKLCPGCQVTVQDTQVGKMATDLGSTAQTLLRRDPLIAWVLPTYDAQGLYIVPAIKAAGLATKVKVVGSDAVSSNLDLVAKGDVQVADVGEPNAWSGWAAVDMLGRALTKGQPVPPNIPLRVFTTSNMAGLNTQDESSLFGGAFRDEYKKVWGLG
jgi:ribose transport system substrate-binding protein